MAKKCTRVLHEQTAADCKGCGRVGQLIPAAHTLLCAACTKAKQTKHAKKGLCISRNCRKKAAGRSLLCARHAKIRWAHRNPIKYTWMVLRNNARRRKKAFSLTFEEFKKFALANGYIEGKGIYPNSLTIDRRLNDEGYHINNIRVITNSENSTKGAGPEEDDGDPF